MSDSFLSFKKNCILYIMIWVYDGGGGGGGVGNFFKTSDWSEL